MIYKHNRKRSQDRPFHQRHDDLPIPLSNRGVHQAERNDSDSIWNLMNWCSQQSLDYIKYVCRYCGQKCENRCNLLRKQELNQRTISMEEDKVKQSLQETKANTQFVNTKKSVTFKEENNKSKIQQSNLGSEIKPKRKNIVERELTEEQKAKLEEQAKSREKFQRECYSIEKYLKKLKPYTRQMPNSAVRLFYEKPCLQSYGRSNTKGSRGFIYGDFMKTHNVQPHRHENQPQKYQTYRSALNFGKRTKLDPEQRWKKIHRQFNNKLDMKELVSDFSAGFIPINDENLNSTLKGSINNLTGQLFTRPKSLTNLQKVSTNGQKLNQTANTSQSKENQLHSRLKRSKSWGKKEYLFLYKYQNKDGDVQYSKDRHGITCYVDPTFQENKQSYTKWLKKIKPIEAEDVAPEDRNIDKIMISNYLKSKQSDLPSHYLMPNCDEPYRPEKFSIKGRKRLASTATTAQE